MANANCNFKYYEKYIIQIKLFHQLRIYPKQLSVISYFVMKIYIYGPSKTRVKRDAFRRYDIHRVLCMSGNIYLKNGPLSSFLNRSVM